jgi:phage host-nuclease inhibitor protein Gam
MTTRRIKALSDIKTREEFERVINDTVDKQIVKERLELRRDAKLLEVRDQFDPDINELADMMQVNVIRAEKYAQAHRDELLPTKLKSAETKFASFGFRTGNPTLVLLNRKWTWAKVVQALKELGGQFRDFVVIKETVDKDGIKARVREDQLAMFGTRIEQTETFYIDPKRDAADPQRIVAEGSVAA